MNNTKHAILTALFATMKSGQTHYTKARIDTIGDLLHKYQGISVKRRWLFECLRHLEEAGLINRQSRHVHRDDGRILQISSLISFTIKGVKYLASKRVMGAFDLLKRMLRYFGSGDKRFPANNSTPEHFTPEQIFENRKRLETLLSSFA